MEITSGPDLFSIFAALASGDLVVFRAAPEDKVMRMIVLSVGRAHGPVGTFRLVLHHTASGMNYVAQYTPERRSGTMQVDPSGNALY